jgi:hypothetical protein
MLSEMNPRKKEKEKENNHNRDECLAETPQEDQLSGQSSDKKPKKGYSPQ